MKSPEIIRKVTIKRTGIIGSQLIYKKFDFKLFIMVM